MVFVGTSIVGALRPINDPMKTMGAEIMIQSKNRTMIVKKLTEVAAFARLKKMFKTMKMATKTAGRAAAVAIVFNFQFDAPQNL